MYFFYIYNNMTNLKERRFILLLFSKLNSFLSKEELMPYIVTTVKELNAIDNDLIIMDSCYHVDLKTRDKTFFKDNNIPKFQSKVLGSLNDITGTEFIIFNN